MHVLPPIGVADQIVRFVESLEVSREWLPPSAQASSFSQNIVHEVHHVASGHSHAVAHEFASIVPFRLDVGFKSFDKSLGFLFVPAASVSAASPAACFFLRRPVVHHGHSCRLLRAHIAHVVEATQELNAQRYLLPVLQIHSSDDRFQFVVVTSNDVSDRI